MQQSPAPPAPTPAPAPHEALPAADGDNDDHDDDDAAVWHYNTPRHGIHGPFSRAQLASFRPYLTRLGRWAGLRVWRAGAEEDTAALVAALLPHV